MLDVGCGTGQATHIFSPYFDSILGIDISAGQIKIANEKNRSENIKFQQVYDNTFPVEDCSIDLINCATTLHLLDLQSFIQECKRVLKSGAVAAIYLYFPGSICVKKSSGKISEQAVKDEFVTAFRRFINECRPNPNDSIWLSSYEDAYPQIDMPSKQWIRGLAFDKEYSLEDFRNFWLTLSLHRNLMAKDPLIDPLEVFMEKIKTMLNVEENAEDKTLVTVTWDVPMIVFLK